MTLETKIQIEVLKMDTEKISRVRYGEGSRAVYLTPNNYYCVRIPESLFMLDRSKLAPMKSLGKFFEFIKDDAKQLAFKHSIDDGKGTKAILACDEFEIHIKADFFKLLSQKGCKIYAENEKSKVVFTMNGSIYAVCMPIIKDQ